MPLVRERCCVEIIWAVIFAKVQLLNACSPGELLAAEGGSADTRIPSRNPQHSFLRFLLFAVKVTEDGLARVSPLETPVQVRDMLNQQLCHHVMMTDQCNLFRATLSYASRRCDQRVHDYMSEVM